MFVIKNTETNQFVKHIGETGTTYDSYPWKFVGEKNEATKYPSLEHANEVVFWDLSTSEKWVIVDMETGEEFNKKTK